MLHENRCVEDITSLRKKAAVHVQYFWDIIKQQIGTLFTAQICGKNINQSSYLSFARIKYASHTYRKTDSLVVMLIQLLKNLQVDILSCQRSPLSGNPLLAVINSRHSVKSRAGEIHSGISPEYYLPQCMDQGHPEPGIVSVCLVVLSPARRICSIVFGTSVNIRHP